MILRYQFIENLKSRYVRWGGVLGRPVAWPLVVVALYLFLAPNVDFVFELDPHDGQRVVQIAVIIFLVMLLALSPAKVAFVDVWTHLSLWVRCALAVIFMLGMVSALQAPLPRWALLEWGFSLLLLVATLTMAAARRELGEQMDVMLVLLCFGTASAYAVTACCIYIAMLLVGPAYGLGFDMRELYTGFSNIRFFGYVQTMLLPFLLLPAMYWGRTWAWRTLFWSVPLIWWMLAMGSGTRGTWVALIAGVIVALWGAGGHARKWALWQLGGFFGGLTGYALFVWGIPQLFDLPVLFLHRTGDIISLSLREVVWSLAWQLTSENPWLGVGPMHFAYLKNEVAAHPHNAVLQWLAEWGIPAGILLAGLWAASGLALTAYVRRAAGQGDERARLFRVALLAALTGSSAQAMVDGVMVMPVSQMLLVLLAGWAMGMIPPPGVTPVAGKLERKLLAVAIMFSAMVVVYGVVPEIGDLAGRQKTFLEGLPEGARLLPRYWAQGWIGP